jgi:hypothetical protein
MTRHFKIFKKVQNKGVKNLKVSNEKVSKEEEIKHNVYLWRIRRSDHGTEGILFTNGFSCATMELPWKNNKRTYSCIPAGEYICVKRFSPGFQKYTYWLKNVPDRSWILIHSGNWSGDIMKGLRSDVYGCILIGKKHAYLANQRAVINSRVTVMEFQMHMQWEPFKLIIKESF